MKEPFSIQGNEEFVLNASKIKIQDIIQVSRFKKKVVLSEDKDFLSRIQNSCEFVTNAVAQKRPMYGINTNFGGLANELLPEEQVEQLQENLIWGLKCGVGNPLPDEMVRAAMFIRIHALSKGCSAIRKVLIDRYVQFLNLGITPIVKELGSIGASGDLVPLSQIAGAAIGLDPSYKVRIDGETVDCLSALKKIHADPIKLRAKEGLALVNSTAMMTGISAGCIYDAKKLFDLTLCIHSFFVQSLESSTDPFDEFVHAVKPHPGQKHVAQMMRDLMNGSKSLKSTKEMADGSGSHKLVQDRYSVRCIPQFLGPIAEGLDIIQNQIEIEANSIDDNPLVDMDRERVVHSGNFMGQYVSVGMDQLRYYIALMTKHLDAQIALVVSPEFNQGLSGSLAGNSEDKVRFGLKGMQICANSIMPRLLHLGSNIATHFPTHAEQFNQNINSQGFNAALLTQESLNLYRHYLSVSLLFAVQAISLRCKLMCGHFDGRSILSGKMIPLYSSVHKILGRQILQEKPLIFKNNEQALDEYAKILFEDLCSGKSELMDAFA